VGWDGMGWDGMGWDGIVLFGSSSILLIIGNVRVTAT
jgi:hypothetical protein